MLDRLDARQGGLDPGAVHLVLDGGLRLEDGTIPDFDRRIGVADLDGLSGSRDGLEIRKEIRLVDGRPTLRIAGGPEA